MHGAHGLSVLEVPSPPSSKLQRDGLAVRSTGGGYDRSSPRPVREIVLSQCVQGKIVSYTVSYRADLMQKYAKYTYGMIRKALYEESEETGDGKEECDLFCTALRWRRRGTLARCS